MRRIAFFGGSFDPPHRGHLAIARAAADRFSLDRVLFAPVGLQPFKASAMQASFIDRYAMVALATQHDARFLPSLADAPRMENGVPQPNYTVDTLARLRAWFAAQQQEISLAVLVGADSWLSLASWRQPEQLLAQADWIIAGRPGFSLEDVAAALPPNERARCESNPVTGEFFLPRPDGGTTRIAVMADLNEEVSATALREVMALQHAAGDLIHPAVADYIRKRRLYVACK